MVFSNSGDPIWFPLVPRTPASRTPRLGLTVAVRACPSFDPGLTDGWSCQPGGNVLQSLMQAIVSILR